MMRPAGDKNHKEENMTNENSRTTHLECEIHVKLTGCPAKWSEEENISQVIS
jgi:hypothetical protein